MAYPNHLRRFRVATSKTTAITSTTPLTIYSVEISIPIKLMPLVNDIITIAPIDDPVTLPAPPAEEILPTYAAAIASN